MLDEDFMLNIFLPLQSKSPEFEAYHTYYSEEKESFPIGSLWSENNVFAVDKAKAELFHVTHAKNQQTQEYCVTLAVEVAGL